MTGPPPHHPLFAAILLTALILGACGERVPGGRGEWIAVGGEGAGGAPHLVVSGRPYEMGWWQGRLLKERIRALHGAWQRAAFGEGERAEALRSVCLVYVDQVRRRLPEAVRQELDGLATASGVPADELLLTEVMRDGLRFHGQGERLPGWLAYEATPLSLTFGPTGADASVLRDASVVIERVPEVGARTVLVTWPGSLGGLLGYADSGLAVLAAEVGLPLERQSLAEAPFTLLLRRALERAADLDDLVTRLGGATAHRVLVGDGRTGTARLVLAGIGAAVTADLSAQPSFVLAPEEGEAGIVTIPLSPPPIPAVARRGWRLAWGEDAWHLAVPGSGAGR